MADTFSGLFGFAAGAATPLGTPMGNSTMNSTMRDILDNPTSLFAALQGLVATWLKLDITTLAAVLTIVGTISGAFKDLQAVASKLYWWVTRFLTSSISVAGKDRLNREVLNWVGGNVLARRAPRLLTASSGLVQSEAWHYRRQVERDDTHADKRQPVQYLPTFGTTWFLFEGRLFVVKRVSTSSTMSFTSVPDEYSAAPEGDEPLIVMCIGRSVAPIKRFLDACRDFADHQNGKFITVKVTKGRFYEDPWDTTILKPMRALETVHFDESTKEDMVADVRGYLDPETRKFYADRGIPYRRGYLLHGPPGTGKTSLSLALAGYFNLELYLLHMPSIGDDSELERLFTALPPRCIVLLEDIDAVGIKRRPDDDEDSENGDDDDDEDRAEYRSCCTLSGLLNVLDGVASQEGRIVLMTSNFADKLDSALVRPGRIDRKVFLGNISQRSAELMFLRMYAPARAVAITSAGAASTGVVDKSRASALAFADAHAEKKALTNSSRLSDEEVRELALRFSKQVTEDTFTPAQLQGYFLGFRDEPTKAAERCAEWVAEEKGRMEEAARKAKAAADKRARKRKEAKLKMLAAEIAASNIEDDLKKREAAASSSSSEAKSEDGVKKEGDDTKEIEKERGSDADCETRTTASSDGQWEEIDEKK